jgi:hypothetical protein
MVGKEYDMSYVDPDKIAGVDEIPYKYLVFRFIGRQRRLSRLQELEHVPKQIIEAEQNLIQRAYNEMRAKCLKDPEFIAGWE